MTAHLGYQKGDSVIEGNARNTWEGLCGTELNLYDVGDVGLSFVYMGYTGLTEARRYRANVNLDLKYDLPLICSFTMRSKL